MKDNLKISLYIPNGKRISDVLDMLRDEYGISYNLRSKEDGVILRKRIDRIVDFLLLMKEVPNCGVAIFSGDGFIFQYPSEPVTIYLYKVDSRFHIEYLSR